PSRRGKPCGSSPILQFLSRVCLSVDADALDRDVDLVDLDADHGLDPVLDGLDDVLGDSGDGDAVFDDDVEVDRSALLREADADAALEVLTAEQLYQAVGRTLGGHRHDADALHRGIPR